MAAEKSYAKLGLFVVVAVIVALLTGLFFVQRIRSREVIKLVTYFTDNVSGLDISSPVRYRGVSIGRVSDIRIVPDPNGGAIEVDFEIFQDRLTTIGGDVRRVRETATLPVFPRLRSRVIGNPVTGEGYLLLDFPTEVPPPPDLGFTPKGAYVPSMPSVLSTLQDRLPEIMDRAQTTLSTLADVVAKIPDTVERNDRILADIHSIVRDSHLPELSADLRAFSRTTSTQMTQIAADVDRVIGAEGTLVTLAEEARGVIRDADVPASTRATRDAADRTVLAADDLRRSLPPILDALEQLRELARRLEAQPESVVYGPRQAKSK